MDLPELIRDVILGVSAATTGISVYMGWMRTKRFVKERDPVDFDYVLIDYGLGIIVTLIAEAVFRSPGIPVTWRAVLYTASLVSVAIGLFRIAFHFDKVVKP